MSSFFGRLIDAMTGRAVPREVRRDLVNNVIAEHPDVVRAAFPDCSGDALFKAINAELVEIIKTAGSVSPSHQAIFAENVMRVALRKRLLSEPDPRRQEMLRVLGERLLRDWYPTPD